MQWVSDAIVLQMKPFSETSFIVTVLSELHGLHSGLLRKKNVNPGDIVEATWTARLPDQLGTWGFELKKAYAWVVMRDPCRLRCFQVFVGVLTEVLLERMACGEIYEKAVHFLHVFADQSEDFARGAAWLWSLLFFELALLPYVGFVLDFKDLAIASEHDPLEFVSPRTGRVVTRSMGWPYKDKLLPFPSTFFKNTEDKNAANVTDTFLLFNTKSLDDLGKLFTITHYFLFKNQTKASGNEQVKELHKQFLFTLGLHTGVDE
jgi:DNA repair protein RecO (recombination protein O)